MNYELSKQNEINNKIKKKKKQKQNNRNKIDIIYKFKNILLFPLLLIIIIS